MSKKPVSSVTIEDVDGERYAQTIRTRGHTLSVDEPTTRGGSDTGPTPVDLMVAALGSCTAITLQMYAERKEWNLGHIRVELNYQIESDAPRIERVIYCSGAAELTEEQRARLLDISNKTPVTRTLLSGISISTELE